MFPAFTLNQSVSPPVATRGRFKKPKYKVKEEAAPLLIVNKSSEKVRTCQTLQPFEGTDPV